MQLGCQTTLKFTAEIQDEMKFPDGSKLVITTCNTELCNNASFMTNSAPEWVCS